MINGRFIAFPGPGLRLLRAPAQRPHHFPDMAGVVADARDPFDHHRDTGQAPELGVQPVGPGASEQGLLHPLKLFGEELGLASSTARSLEPAAATALPLVKPVFGRLPGDAQAPSDLRLMKTPAEKFGGFHSPLFHSGEITPGPIPFGLLGFHASIINMEYIFVKLFCEIQ